MVAQVVSPDALAAIIAIIAALVIAIVRRLLTLHDLIREMSERIAWLEAKINGKSD